MKSAMKSFVPFGKSKHGNGCGAQLHSVLLKIQVLWCAPQPSTHTTLSRPREIVLRKKVTCTFLSHLLTQLASSVSLWRNGACLHNFTTVRSP